MSHGNLIGRGPGFGSGAYDWVSRMLQRYNKTSLFQQTGPFGTESVHLKRTYELCADGQARQCTKLYISQIIILTMRFQEIIMITCF